MMKVLAAIVVPPHMSVSGGARAAELLSSALADHCDMTVASMMNGEGPARQRPAAGCPPASRCKAGCRRSCRGRNSPTATARCSIARTCPAIVRKGEFDLVHIHNPMPAHGDGARRARLFAAGVPYVVSTHGFNEVANGGEVYGFGGAKRLAWKTLVAGPVAASSLQADGIFALSPADFDIVRAMGFAGSELSVVTNGVPIPELDAPARRCRDTGPARHAPAAKAPGRSPACSSAITRRTRACRSCWTRSPGLERPYLLIVGGEKRPDIDYDATCAESGRASRSSSPAG